MTGILFSPTSLGRLELQNHIVMSPMTRNRAIGNIPNDLMVEYYTQRASAGLIITEGTSPSPNGLGYPRIPGIFSPEQTQAWSHVTRSVHANGAKIFMQLMHTGRISHPLNMPTVARVLAPSAVAATGEMYTDAEGPKPHPVPDAMTEADIKSTKQEYVQAAGMPSLPVSMVSNYTAPMAIFSNSLFDPIPTCARIAMAGRSRTGHALY